MASETMRNPPCLARKKDSPILSSWIAVKVYFIAAPIVDALTGSLVLTGIMPPGSLFTPSQVFRLGFILVFLSSFATSRRRAWLYVISVIALLLLESAHGLTFRSLSGLLSAYSTPAKILFACLLFDALLIARVETDRLLRVFVLSAIMYAVPILVGIVFSVGFDTYATGFGSKGLFASGNALSVTLGAGFALAITLDQRISTAQSLISVLVLALATFSIGTRGAYAFVLVVLLLAVVGGWRRVALFPAIVGSGFVAFRNLDSVVASRVFRVITTRFSNASFITFLFSGRDQKLITGLEALVDRRSLLIPVLFGSGSYMSFRTTPASEFQLIEQDWADAFFFYGALGLVFYVAFLGYATGVAVKGAKNGYWAGAAVIILVVVHSLLAGHVVFNMMSMTAFSSVLAILSRYDRSRLKHA